MFFARELHTSMVKKCSQIDHDVVNQHSRLYFHYYDMITSDSVAAKALKTWGQL